MSESKKVEGGGWGREKEGTLARKPPDFEKRPLVFTIKFIYLIDNFAPSLKKKNNSATKYLVGGQKSLTFPVV